MKNKSVQNCRFVHHARFHFLVTTLKRLLKIEFERGETGKEPKVIPIFGSFYFFSQPSFKILSKFVKLCRSLCKLTYGLITPLQTYLVIIMNLLKSLVTSKTDAQARLWGELALAPFSGTTPRVDQNFLSYNFYI